MPVFNPPASGITIGTTPVIGGTVGSVLFIGAGGVVAEDNANFFWDDTNNRLGVGTNSPAGKITSFSVYSDPTTSQYGGGFEMNPDITANNVWNHFALSGVVQPAVATGVTVSGSMYGLQFVGVRNQIDDFGDIAGMYGELLQVGHMAPAQTSIVTTDVYGSRVEQYAALGTIGTFYGFSVNAMSSGATITNSYGFYSDPVVGATLTKSFYGTKDIDTALGYQVAGAAASGHVIRGNGTRGVFAQLQAADIGGGAALTKTDDTNVTLTLGGAPTTALLTAASLTLGWTGQLAITRGGTGQATAQAAFDALAPTTTRGDLIVRDATTNTRLGAGITSTNKFLRSDGTDPSWQLLVAGDLPANGANPTATIGLSAVNGSATTWMRSDGAPALGQDIAPTWTNVHHFQENDIRSTATDQVFIDNTTAATVTNKQQISPALNFRGASWNNGLGVSYSSNFRIDNKPTAATGYLTIQADINGGGYNNAAVLSDSGALTLGTVGFGGGGQVIFNGVTSGAALLGVAAAAGTPTLVLPTQTGQLMGLIYVGSDAGGDDTYVISPTYAPTAYLPGMMAILTVTTANTGAASLDIGPGASTIVKRSATTLANSDMAAGSVNILVHNGTNWVLLNPAVH